MLTSTIHLTTPKPIPMTANFFVIVFHLDQKNQPQANGSANFQAGSSTSGGKVPKTSIHKHKFFQIFLPFSPNLRKFVYCASYVQVQK